MENEDDYVRFNSGKISKWATYKINKSMGPRFVYVLKCQDDKLYCGETRSVIRRLVEHASGEGSPFTIRNSPLSLLHIEELPSYLDAVNRETEIWKRIKKGEPVEFSIMQEYVGIYDIIQNLLLNHKPKWVINKLSNI